MNTAAPAPLDDAMVIRVLQASKAEAAAGRMQESDELLARVAQQSPNHPAVLNELGVRMLARGAPEQAQALFARATGMDPGRPALWANLASSLKALGRREEELDAIEKALELEPRHLSALLQKGAYLEETGDPRNAARIYQNMLDCLPPGAEVAPQIKDAVAHAKARVDADLAALSAALEEPLAQVRERHGGARQHRVDQCLDTLMGKRRAYHSQPTWMYFPQLPAIEFFERSDFPWLDAVEAATPEIRAELLRVLVADREGLATVYRLPQRHAARSIPRAEPLAPLERVLSLESGRSHRRSHRALPRHGAHSRGCAQMPGGAPGAHRIFFHPGCKDAHPAAYGRSPIHASRFTCR